MCSNDGGNSQSVSQSVSQSAVIDELELRDDDDRHQHTVRVQYRILVLVAPADIVSVRVLVRCYHMRVPSQNLKP